MEYVILLAIIISYASISSKLKSISKKIPTKDTYKKLNDFVGKTVVITFDDDYGIKRGKLLSYDSKFIELECISKNSKQLCYYKKKGIISISVEEN